MSSFRDLRIVDNFYQTSAFFPMPTVLVGTLDENGQTNLGSYSLCFPYYIAGKDRYAMLLECRNSSNTAQHILAGSKVSLNFIPDDRKYFREAVRLGFPGDTTAQKMKDCLFTLEKGQAEGERPLVVKEAFQVFECTWAKKTRTSISPGSSKATNRPTAISTASRASSARTLSSRSIRSS